MSRILSIVKKDITQIFRNRFLAVITFLVIFAYALVYVMLPSKVDETFKIGIYLQYGRGAIEQSLSQEQGIEVKWANSIDELKKIVAAEDVGIGFAFMTVDSKPAVQFYVSSQAPEEIKEAGGVIGKELAYNILGYKLQIESQEEVIGPDMAGQQIPSRNKLRILFLVFVLVVEMYSLANILMEEIQKKTIDALLITPVNLKEYITAKAVTGISLAFFEGLLAAVLLRVLDLSTLSALIILLLLGSILVTAISFIIGSISKNFVSLIMNGVLPLLILVLPGAVLVFPSAFSPLMKAIPTYHLISPLDGIINYNLSLTKYLPQIFYLVLFDISFFVIGFALLKKRVL